MLKKYQIARILLASILLFLPIYTKESITSLPVNTFSNITKKLNFVNLNSKNKKGKLFKRIYLFGQLHSNGK